MILKRQDFVKLGSQGVSLDRDQTIKPSPCDKCDHRKRCIAENLACERYRYYSSSATYHHPESYYMSKSCWPNRMDFQEVWGDFEPEVRQPLPEKRKATATKTEIMAAIDAIKNAEYPADSIRARQIMGSYTSWKKKNDELLGTLRSRLAELQA